MLTFQDQHLMTQQISGNYDADQLVLFKRDINEGGTVFLNRLGRKFNRQYKNASLVAGQQYYQLPMDVIRVGEVSITVGSFVYHPSLVASEEAWILLNQTSVTGDFPTHYFVRGFNEIGIYPIPASSMSNALRVSYEPQHTELIYDDFTSGTVTVTEGSTTITHSATGFVPSMVGRMFQVTDGTDGNWYRVATYNSSSSLDLENVYQGASNPGKSFRIGQVMKIPQGYQDAPVYFALGRYYLGRNDQSSAAVYDNRFDAKLKSAKETYGRSTSRLGVKNSMPRKYRPWMDAPPAINYP